MTHINLISINRLSMYGEIMTHRVRKTEINYIPFIMIIYFRKIPMICLVSNFGKGTMWGIFFLIEVDKWGVTLKVRFGKFIFLYYYRYMASSENDVLPLLQIMKKLCEASIKSIKAVDENGKSFAVILYSDFQERRVPLKRLQEVKSVKDCSRNFIFDDEDLEKPWLPRPKISIVSCSFSTIWKWETPFLILSIGI